MKKNFLFSLFNVAASVISSLLLLPIIQWYLGIEAYGYSAVALSFVNIATVVSVAITSMSSRFIAVSANQGESDKTQKFFSTILLCCCLLGIAVVFVFLAISLNIDLVMNIESVSRDQITILLVVLSLSLCCTLVKTPFVSGLYYSNDLYIDYCFMGLSQLARVLVPFIAFQFVTPALWIPYLGAFAVDCFAVIFYLLNYKKYLPGVDLSFRKARLQEFKEIISSGAWVSLTKAGAVLLSTINLYLANILFASYDVGIFASITQVQSFMSVFTTAIVSIFVPSLYKSYAQGEDDLKKTFVHNHIIVSSILGICFGFIAAWAVPFLQLWTNEDMLSYIVMIFVMTAYPLFSYPAEYLNQLFIAKTHVKHPAIATIFFGFLNIILVFVFTVYFNLGILALALAQAISVLSRNYFVYVPIGAKLLGGGLRNLILICKLEFQAVFSGVVVYITCYSISCFMFPVSWLELILIGLASFLVSSLLALITVPTKERSFLLSRFFIRKNNQK